MFLVKCSYHGNALSYPSYITFMHIYTSISSIHASLKKLHLKVNEELSAQEFFNVLVKCGYHGNALSYPSYITFTHIYTSISSIHASLKKFHKTMNEELSAQEFLNVFSKMWLPWQRLVVPKLYHLYAHVSIHQYHPSMQV